MSSVALDRRREPSLRDRREQARRRLGHRGRARREGGIVLRWFRRHAGEPLPETVGPAPAAFYVIGLIVLVFVTLGLVMVLSSTGAGAVGGDESPYLVFGRQAVWAALGGLALLIAMKVPYEFWRPLAAPAFVLATASMFLPFVPGVGTTINDTRAWVHVGGLSFQPSEVMKLASLLFISRLYADSRRPLHDVRHGLGPVVVVAGVGAVLCLAQGDFGSAVVLAAVITAAGFLAGLPVRHLSAMVLAGAGFMLLFVVSSERRIQRFTAFLDLRGNREHASYQTYQGLLSMANGGLTGSGIGGSNGKLGYLPLAHSDFIFAIIADELGFIGSVAVVGGFSLLVWFGIQVALAAPDRFGMLLAGGIAGWFGVQTLVNLGGVTGLMPVTGLTLPFFSVGGTSLFVMMTASGILLNVARRTV